MNVEEYTKQILEISNNIEETLKNIKPNCYAFDYIINIQKDFKNSLESLVKNKKINKYELEILKLQDERDRIMKSNIKIEDLQIKLMELNQQMVDLNLLKHS